MDMGRPLCPVCGAPVPPVPLGDRVVSGRIVGPNPAGLLIERRQCPACGEHLERTAMHYWYRAGDLAPNDVALVRVR
jgi:uncharacterized protein (UPF0212 family)